MPARRTYGSTADHELMLVALQRERQHRPPTPRRTEITIESEVTTMAEKTPERTPERVPERVPADTGNQAGGEFQQHPRKTK